MLYLPTSALEGAEFKTKTLIVERCSPAPTSIKAEQTLCWATDTYHEGYDIQAEHTMVFVSSWQSQGFPTDKFKKRVIIPNMLPDWVYELKPNRNTPATSFIFASAASKGLKATLAYFESMRTSRDLRGAKLTVATPGYDGIKDPKAKGVNYLGALPFRALVKEMQATRNLLYVSTFQETFCIVAVLAEVLGLNLFVYQGRGRDAMSEVCNSPGISAKQDEFNARVQAFAAAPQSLRSKNRDAFGTDANDYRVSSVLPAWLMACRRRRRVPDPMKDRF